VESSPCNIRRPVRGKFPALSVTLMEIGEFGESPIETWTITGAPAAGPLFRPIDRVLPLTATVTALELELAL
jgi:hypothetical protein